jgi:hypothetical protein
MVGVGHPSEESKHTKFFNGSAVAPPSVRTNAASGGHSPIPIDATQKRLMPRVDEWGPCVLSATYFRFFILQSDANKSRSSPAHIHLDFFYGMQLNTHTSPRLIETVV